MPLLCLLLALGTTSAHAENTDTIRDLRLALRNYLRARGEYDLLFILAFILRELPPRTRRIPFLDFTHMPEDRTTSAHAENTARITSLRGIRRNYLRARGEYIDIGALFLAVEELPPRTRRIQHHSSSVSSSPGTTSAHAENTYPHGWFGKTFGNYLRARGEYNGPKPPTAPAAELPPRTRRILVKLIAATEPSGTTSAHAENTGA